MADIQAEKIRDYDIERLNEEALRIYNKLIKDGKQKQNRVPDKEPE